MLGLATSLDRGDPWLLLTSVNNQKKITGGRIPWIRGTIEIQKAYVDEYYFSKSDSQMVF